MARRLTATRHLVKRMHTRDRRKDYVAPTERDVQCPHYDGLFLLVGKAPVVNDMFAYCEDTTGVDCDYKEKLFDITLCKRYWKTSINDFTHEWTIAEDDTIDWQKLHIKYHFQRLFKEKTADVSLVMTKAVSYNIDLGNFLLEWNQWYEQQPGDWKQRKNGSRTEIYNAVNQNGRSFWYNAAHKRYRNYTHSYYVQARGADNDMYGSVFRYNPDTGHFYSFEWDSKGLGINGMAIYRNIRQANGTYTKTRLAHAGVIWEEGKKYIHHVVLEIINNRITAIIYRVSGTTETQIAKLEIVDTSPDALFEGAWGPMTNSQPDTYFWEIKYEESIVIDKSIYPALTKSIPLEYVSKVGANYIVSENIDDYFKEDIEIALKGYGITMADIKRKEYIIDNTNVVEGVYFVPSTFSPLVTETPSAKIAMSSFNYGANLDYIHDMTIIDRNPSSHSHLYLSDTDKFLTQVEISTTRRHYFDNMFVKVKGVLFRLVPNVDHTTYLFDISSAPISMKIDDTVELVYNSSSFDLEAYRGGFIDTHDKIFTLRGNILDWHHIPSRE